MLAVLRWVAVSIYSIGEQARMVEPFNLLHLIFVLLRETDDCLYQHSFVFIYTCLSIGVGVGLCYKKIEGK